MAFPSDPLDVAVEIFVDDAWEDITAFVLHRGRIRIARGRSDEAASVQHARCSLTLDNSDGRFSEDNPTGPYYGQIGLNTPIRVSVGEGSDAVRFHGEFSAAPTDWDPSGSYVHMKVKAAGILRRLVQGAKPLDSTMKRGILGNSEALVAYWPLEDDTGSASLASALDGAPAMTIHGSNFDLAAFDGFAASKPIPELGEAKLIGQIPPYTATGEVQTRFILKIPAAQSTNGTLISVFTEGTIARWDLDYSTSFGGVVWTSGYDVNGNAVFTGSTGTSITTKDGNEIQLSWELRQDGSDIVHLISRVEPGITGGFVSFTAAGQTLGRAHRVEVNRQFVHDDVAIGHIRVQAAQTQLSETRDELNAWIGETAADRIERLCDEHDVPVTIVGTAADSAVMGPQLPKTLVDLLQEAADADMGILNDARGSLGLVYRTRVSLDVATVLELDYDDKVFSKAPQPVTDDQQVRNDITVKRVRGSSARAVQTEGRRSVEAVGTYDESVEVNVSDDGALADQAGFRLHQGTVEKPRFPVVAVNFAAPEVAGDAALVAALEEVDPGRVRLDLLNLRSDDRPWLPAGDQKVVVFGYTETLESFTRTIEFNTVPYEPYRIATYTQADEIPRYDTAGSELFGLLADDEGDDSESVQTTVGPRWVDSTNYPDEFPFDVMIGGERMTVTAISGTTTLQTFTFTRAVNGVLKEHASGSDVRLADPTHYTIT